VAIDMSRSPIPKGEPRKRTKARRQRAEKTRKVWVRARVMARDHDRCRLSWYAETQALFGACSGELQWAHWGPYRRSKTRGQAPERRHCQQGGLALCDGHHDDYDEGRLTIDALTEQECDGRLRFERDGQVWEEPAA